MEASCCGSGRRNAALHADHRPRNSFSMTGGGEGVGECMGPLEKGRRQVSLGIGSL